MNSFSRAGRHHQRVEPKQPRFCRRTAHRPTHHRAAQSRVWQRDGRWSGLPGGHHEPPALTASTTKLSWPGAPAHGQRRVPRPLHEPTQPRGRHAAALPPLDVSFRDTLPCPSFHGQGWKIRPNATSVVPQSVHSIPVRKQTSRARLPQVFHSHRTRHDRNESRPHPPPVTGQFTN